MKTAIALLLMLVLASPIIAQNQQYSATVDISIVAADVNAANRDTARSGIYNLANVSAPIYYFQARIQGVDTVFSGDTFRIITETACDAGDSWTLFDSVVIVLNGNVDTNYTFAKRYNSDSLNVGNLFRIRGVNFFKLGNTAGDLAIVGNKYPFDFKFYMIPKW